MIHDGCAYGATEEPMYCIASSATRVCILVVALCCTIWPFVFKLPPHRMNINSAAPRQTFCSASPVDPDPEGIFVYGSLRPDENSNMEWTQSFNEGMRSLPARLFGYRLYKQSYAMVISPDPTAQPTDFVVGHVLRPLESKDWKHKFAEADYIEGCPHFYRRKVIAATLSDGTTLPAWVYFREEDPSNAKLIPSGDWKKRNDET